MQEHAVDILAQAIAAHRDSKLEAGEPLEDRDFKLYNQLIWWESWKDHAYPEDAYGLLPNW